MMKYFPLGWLSPEGEIIECESMEHLRVAKNLIEMRYHELEDCAPDEYLMNHGWAHLTRYCMISHEFLVFWKYGSHLTNAQREFLRPIVKDNWEWFSKSSKLDLKDELDLDLEI